MFIDDSHIVSNNMWRAPASPLFSADRTEPEHTFDDLDDVFGPASPSPRVSTVELSSSLPIQDTSSPPSVTRIQDEPSDIPRLRSAHSTAGYRDGVAFAKSTQIQAGFDEGYSLGAAIGIRIGELLGKLRGVAEAACTAEKASTNEQVQWPPPLYNSSIISQETATVVERADAVRIVTDEQRLLGLYDAANRELTTVNVFAREWWDADGAWKFQVPGETTDDATFQDVAAAHPLLKKWSSIVDQECKAYLVVVGELEPEAEGL